jgi:hypothetical protein
VVSEKRTAIPLPDELLFPSLDVSSIQVPDNDGSSSRQKMAIAAPRDVFEIEEVWVFPFSSYFKPTATAVPIAAPTHVLPEAAMRAMGEEASAFRYAPSSVPLAHASATRTSLTSKAGYSVETNYVA